MRNKHILVPLELVRGPARALVAAQEMAAESPLCVTLLHVIDLNIFPVQTEINDQLCAESQAALRKLAKLFFGAEQAVRVIVRFGEPAEEITAEARESQPDLIVMCGPKSKRLRMLRRGTTQSVLKSAPCPTLVLPHPGKAGAVLTGRVRGNRLPEESYCFETTAPQAAVS